MGRDGAADQCNKCEVNIKPGHVVETKAVVVNSCNGHLDDDDDEIDSGAYYLSCTVKPSFLY